VWIQVDSGRILRAEITVVEPGLGLRCALDVMFHLDPRMGMAVPARMTERYYSRNREAISGGDAFTPTTASSWLSQKKTSESDSPLTPNAPRRPIRHACCMAVSYD
jgi:hypothetical protein